jgi:Cof subfamily protein (haloacid dehalogenase superfamily)
VQLPFRLLALDIDGTLLNPKFEISATDLSALRQVHAAGAEIILCTGRRHTFALPISRLLGFDVWMCSSNGAVTRSSAGEDFHRDLLPAAIARAWCQHMREFRGSTVLTFDQETSGALVVERTEELRTIVRHWVEMNTAYIKLVQPIEAALTQDPIQAMICGSIAGIARAEAVHASFPEIGHVTVLKTQYDHRDLALMDVLTNGCSKGHAVERWAKYRGIPHTEIMAIGDNFNDIEMLELAGIPVIMGNAPDELKRRGWIQTLGHHESGVAAAIAMVSNGSIVAAVPEG